MNDISPKTAQALVLEEFSKPLVLREFDLPEPGPGEVLAKVIAAGVCGSDLHIMKGDDPRTPLPIIPGHEGVGEVVSLGPRIYDGLNIEPGMPIVWERSLTCGTCYHCQRDESNLCTERKVYGINISSSEPPHLSGCYATHILLKSGTSIYPRNPEIDPAVLVAATCSGATAAHAHEYTGIRGRETVLIYGSGPLAAFQIAFALDAGAKWVVVITRNSGLKADIAHEFGADEVLFRSQMDAQKIRSYLMFQTGKIGVDVVIDTTPDPKVFPEALSVLRNGGKYINPGLAIPADPVPLDLYQDIVRKNIAIHGVWTSKPPHLEHAIKIVEAGIYPFDKLVTHRFGLEDHIEACKVLENREGMKIVFEPWIEH